MFKRIVRGFQHLALLLARVTVGGVLVARGWHRWFGTGIDEQARILAEAGLPSPELLAWLVTLFELAGGTLLVFGLGTPIVGLGTTVLALGTGWVRHSHAFLRHEGGLEYHLVLAAAGLLLCAFGSGRLGADALFRAPRERPSDDTIDATPPEETPRETTVFSQESHS